MMRKIIIERKKLVIKERAGKPIIERDRKKKVKT